MDNLDFDNERELFSSYESMFKNMLEGIAVHKMIYDDNGDPKDYIYLDINPAFTEITGLDKSIIGKSVLEIMPKTERYWIETFGYTAKTGQAQRYENYAKEFNKYYDVVVYSHKKDYFTIIFKDITRIKKSELSYKNIFDNSPIGMFKISLNEKVINCNKSFLEIFKYNDMDDFREDMITSDNMQDVISAILSIGENAKDIILNITDRYKKEIICKVSTIDFKFEDGIDVIEGTILDITEALYNEEALKLSKERLKMAVEITGIGTFDFDFDNNSFYISDNIYIKIGYNENEINYENLFDIIHPEYKPELKKRIEHCIEYSKSCDCFEYKVKGKNGEYYWFRSIAKKIGNKRRIFGTTLLIHNEKIKQDQIRYFAEHDILTNLYNRNYFEQLVEKKEISFPAAITMFDLDGLKILNDAFGHKEGDNYIKCISSILVEIYSDDEDSIIFRLGGDEFAVITQNVSIRQVEAKLDRVRYKTNKIKFMAINTSVSGGYSYSEKPKDISKMLQEAEESMYRNKLLKRQSNRGDMIKSLMVTLDAKTHETNRHSARIEYIAVKIGEKLNLKRNVKNDLKLVAQLHDIGKIAISDNILDKKGKLNDNEWEIMKRHSEIGYRIVASIRDLNEVAESILYHHERWDGKGYPKGLMGVSIPLTSRIIAVADSYDAMTNDRSYRKRMSHEEAVDEIKRNSGTQFDPNIVDAFMQII